MTDHDYILALSDEIPASEIAYKLEVPLTLVLRTLRESGQRQNRTISVESMRAVVGDDPFIVSTLAAALFIDDSTLRSRLCALVKQGKAERVGVTDYWNGTKATLWKLRGL